MADQKLKNKMVMPSSPPHKKIKKSHGDNNVATFPFHLLPFDVVENVLSFLPITKLGRCSSLSKRFRNSWRTCRNLCFDRQFHRGRNREDFVVVVNHILNNHRGPNIQKFHLYFDHSGMEFLVNIWIGFAIHKGVEELHLDFRLGQAPFILVSDRIDVKTISVLNLTNCAFFLSPNINGLRFLKYLSLEKMRVIPGLIKSLFSNCLLLENLELTSCSSLNRIIISAKKLRNFKVLKIKNCKDIFAIHLDSPTVCTFHYIGDLCKMKFYSIMRDLKDVILNILPLRGFQQIFSRENLMFCLKEVTQKLTISSTFLEGFSPRFQNFEYKEAEFYFWFLKEFELSISVHSYLNPADIGYFLKRCPRLEKVIIDLDEFKFQSSLIWDIDIKPQFLVIEAWFPFLKYIKIKGFKYLKPELELIKFFLKKATQLENLIIVQAKKIYPLKPDFEFLYCLRTSNADIEFIEHPFTKVVQQNFL